MKKIDSFFKPMSAIRNRANLLLDKISLDEKIEKEANEKTVKAANLKAKMKERIAESRKRRADVKETDAYIPDDCELLQDGIDAIFNEETNPLIDDSVWKKPKKTWDKRPDNWQFTASESAIYGTASVIRSFKEVFKGLTSSAAKQRVIKERFENS